MSQRPGVRTSIVRKVEPGVSPNAFIGELAAEVRVHWTPYTPWVDVQEAIEDAADAAIKEAREKYEAEGHPWPLGVGSLPGDLERELEHRERLIAAKHEEQS